MNGQAHRHFLSFDTYLAPFVKVDNLSYPEVKKCIESLYMGEHTKPLGNTGTIFQYYTGLDCTG